jgi:hypothetical protein
VPALLGAAAPIAVGILAKVGFGLKKGWLLNYHKKVHGAVYRNNGLRLLG